MMLKLSENFYITSIRKDSFSFASRSRLEQTSEYYFRYKNFQIKLSVICTIVGYTDRDNMAIVNFGYSVDVRRWSDKRQRFVYIDGLDEENGRSTKQYFDDPGARAIVLCFVERALEKYLKTVSPAILIRGAFDQIQINLPRYRRLDRVLLDCGYHKKVFDGNMSESLCKITPRYGEEEKKLIWVYCRHEASFEKLAQVFR